MKTYAVRSRTSLLLLGLSLVPLGALASASPCPTAWGFWRVGIMESEGHQLRPER